MLIGVMASESVQLLEMHMYTGVTCKILGLKWKARQL